MWDFDMESVVNVYFYISVEERSSEGRYQVPIGIDVQNTLISMLDTTHIEIQPTEDQQLRQFEISEKYGSKESLITPLYSEGYEKIGELYTTGFPLCSAEFIEIANNVIYYFAEFIDNNGKKLVGVRRASQFKAILSARKRLIRWIDNTLKVVDFNLFRLDNDFDFVIGRNEIYILRPSGFEFVADFPSTLCDKKIDEKINSLSTRLSFLSFEGISDLAKNRSRVARLIAAISIRKDLEEINQEKFKEAARATNVELEEIGGGKLKPSIGNELGLLELLDYRRYTADLTDDTPSIFCADSRRKIS